MARSQGFGSRGKRPGIARVTQMTSPGADLDRGEVRGGFFRARMMLVAYLAALAFCLFGLPVVASALRPLDQALVDRWGPPQQKHQANRY